MEAEDKWLNFNRYDLQPVFQSNHSPGFTPAAQLYCLNSNLPSLQQCLQCWEAAALEATRVTPSLCPAMILWPGPNESSWEQEEPQPPPLPACCRGGSEGSTAQLASGESLQQLPCCHLISREGQQPMETRTQCSHRLDPSPRVWEHPRDLKPCELFTAHTSSGTHCNRQGKNFRLLRNGALWSLLLKALYNLQWNVLWSAKYYC